MDYENELALAIDALADDDVKKAEIIIGKLIEYAKKNLNGTLGDASHLYAWGRGLRLLEEPEQALLRLEMVFGLIPDHEGALWEMASILLHDLDRAEAASEILEKKLLPIRPDEELYREALDSARFRLRLSALPPEAPDDPI